MLAINRSFEKIGKFLDYPKIKITPETPDDIKQIVSYKDKMLEMVYSKKLTYEDYLDFRKNISKHTVSNFVDFIGIYNILFEVPLSDLREEITHLFDIGFISNSKEQSDITKISTALTEIRSRVMGVSSNFINMEISAQTDDRKVSLNNLLSNLEDENSATLETLRDFYIEWVKKTFIISSVRTAMLELTELFISETKKAILQKIKYEGSKKSVPDKYETETIFARKIRKTKRIKSF